ncbi:MAG: hypothetical protein KBC73_24475 [Burkholderiaceae bacterium]|nr:hypothetical protein [Burkholderiaceae bacterium]
MKNLQDATERICELKGSLVAMEALLGAMLLALSSDQRARLAPLHERLAEVARTVLLNAETSELTLAAFERDVARGASLIAG